MATRRLDSKSARVRELLARGVAAGEIARQVGCTVGLVYNVKSRMGRTLPRPRPRQLSGHATTGIDEFIATVRRSEQERQRLRATLEAVGRLVAQVL
jgi:hypothetical protein